MTLIPLYAPAGISPAYPVSPCPTSGGWACTSRTAPTFPDVHPGQQDGVPRRQSAHGDRNNLCSWQRLFHKVPAWN